MEHYDVDDDVEQNAGVILQELESMLKNPLEGVPLEKLRRNIEDFVREHGLEEYADDFRRGAYLAQDDKLIYRAEEDQPCMFSQDERTQLHNESHTMWKHLSRRLKFTIAVCCIGAAVQGWDQTGSNGATIFFPAVYGIDSNSVKDKLIVGLINAAPYLGASLMGCWVADPINRRFGRRWAIFIAALFCLFPTIGSAACHSWGTQLFCRLLMGIGMGLKASTVPVYAAENSPTAVRGRLVMMWQVFTALGIFLGTAANLALWRTGPNNWRFMLGAPFLPAVPLLVMVAHCPESPRWLMTKGRYDEAWHALVKVRRLKVQAARDMYLCHRQLLVEEMLTRVRQVVATGTHTDTKTSYLRRFQQLFTVPRTRRALLAAVIVMIGQQLCGINIIAFYSASVFREAGASEQVALVASLGFGAINFLGALPAFWTIDHFGRRALLLFTFPNMMWTLLAAGLSTLIQSSARTWVIAAFVYLFAMFYSPGEGPVPFTYSAEVFPHTNREAGMAFSVVSCFFFSAILGITFPFLLQATGTIGAFGLYAAFNLVAFILIFLFVPETKQKTLEELDTVFSVPASTFAKYQVTEALPWFVQCKILRRNVELRPLIEDNSADQSVELQLMVPAEPSASGPSQATQA